MIIKTERNDLLYGIKRKDENTSHISVFIGEMNRLEMFKIEMQNIRIIFGRKYMLNEDGVYAQYISEDDKVHYGTVNSQNDEFILNEGWKTYEEMRNAVMNN